MHTKNYNKIYLYKYFKVQMICVKILQENKINITKFVKKENNWNKFCTKNWRKVLKHNFEGNFETMS